MELANNKSNKGRILRLKTHAGSSFMTYCEQLTLSLFY